MTETSAIHGVDDELSCALHDADDSACTLTLALTLPVLDRLAIHLHVPIPVRRTAITPLAAWLRGLQRLIVLGGVERETDALGDRHILVDGTVVRVELFSINDLLLARFGVHVNRGVLLPRVHVILDTGEGVFKAHLDIIISTTGDLCFAPQLLPRSLPAGCRAQEKQGGHGTREGREANAVGEACAAGHLRPLRFATSVAAERAPV
mmetsp:Transcript_80514/g.260811  ORF Transcript_80514/g.260811 Transcript_80514/m.260811 type:complete len:207 (-) Transcript_80514:124-744(-)